MTPDMTSEPALGLAKDHSGKPPSAPGVMQPPSAWDDPSASSFDTDGTGRRSDRLRSRHIHASGIPASRSHAISTVSIDMALASEGEALVADLVRRAALAPLTYR